MTDGPSRILVVEDERSIAAGILENLEAEGYEVEIALDGTQGLDAIRKKRFDLVVLDVMLPEMDGFAVCETARAEGCAVPILFLTARTAVDDRIRGLEAGGDDYIAKPFHLRELLLRVAAILRRRGWYEQMPAQGSAISFGGNEFDFFTCTGRTWDGGQAALTQKEAMILKALSEREGEVVTREEILEKVWGYDLFPSTRTIDDLIRQLRKRFERDPDNPRHFHTVRGVGYRFTQKEEGNE
jgi:two-component system alkaline phosphatase synthesis response regulator PhoP